MKLCYPYLKDSQGSVINLGTGAAIRPDPKGFGAYTAVKEAIRSLSRPTAVEWCKDGIRVNCLCPGFVETQLTESLTNNPDTNEYLKALHPMGRLGQPDEIANAALFLSSDEASFITGASLAIDGGYTSQ